MLFWIAVVLFLAVLGRAGGANRSGRVRLLPVFMHGIIGAIAVSTITSANHSEAE